MKAGDITNETFLIPSFEGLVKVPKGEVRWTRDDNAHGLNPMGMDDNIGVIPDRDFVTSNGYHWPPTAGHYLGKDEVVIVVSPDASIVNFHTAEKLAIRKGADADKLYLALNWYVRTGGVDHEAALSGDGWEMREGQIYWLDRDDPSRFVFADLYDRA